MEAAATSGADRVILGGETFNHIALTKDAWKRAGNIAKQYGISLWAATPRILWNRSIPLVRKELSQAIEGGVAGIYIGSMGAFTLVRDMALDVPFSADWSLNIFNTQSLKAYEKRDWQKSLFRQRRHLSKYRQWQNRRIRPSKYWGRDGLK